MPVPFGKLRIEVQYAIEGDDQVLKVVKEVSHEDLGRTINGQVRPEWEAAHLVRLVLQSIEFYREHPMAEQARAWCAVGDGRAVRFDKVTGDVQFLFPSGALHRQVTSRASSAGNQPEPRA